MRNQLGLLPLRTGNSNIIQSTDIFNSMSFTLLETGELDISNSEVGCSVYSLKKIHLVWERRNWLSINEEQQGVDKDNDDPNFN